MGNNNYLIPANSKRSMLILSFFNQVDLIIFGIGIGITFIFMFTFNAANISGAILILLPALIVTFLVVPIPYHHNVRTLIKNIYNYYTKRRTYYWKGWCVGDADAEEN